MSEVKAYPDVIKADTDEIKIIFRKKDGVIDDGVHVLWPGEQMPSRNITDYDKDIDLEIIGVEVREGLENTVEALRLLDIGIDHSVSSIYNLIGDVATAVRRASKTK